MAQTPQSCLPLWSDAALTKCFYVYLQQIKQTTLFDLWLEIERFKILPFQDLLSNANYIFQQFLAENSKHAVQFSSKVMKSFESYPFDAKQIDRDMFSSCQEAIERLLLSVYSTFVKSELYEQFRKSENIPPLERTEHSLIFECIYYSKTFHNIKLKYPMRSKQVVKTIKSIKDNDDRTLRTFDASGNIHAEEQPKLFHSLTKAMQMNVTLVHLNLSHIHLRDRQLQELITALSKNSTLISLDISHNLLTDAGITHFIYMLRENTECGLKQIHMYGNTNVSINTELLIWHVLASHHLPTAINMVGTEEQRKQKQLSKLLHFRKKLTFVMNDIQNYESQNMRLVEVDRQARKAVTEAIEQACSKPDESASGGGGSGSGIKMNRNMPSTIQLMNCISECCFTCEVNEMQCDLEWIWKDSVVKNWKQAVYDLTILCQLTKHSFIQRYFLYFQTNVMMLVLMSPSGTLLHSVIARKHRQRIASTLPLSSSSPSSPSSSSSANANTVALSSLPSMRYDFEWDIFTLQVAYMLAHALSFLHSRSIFLYFLTPNNISVYGEMSSVPRVKITGLHNRVDRIKHATKSDFVYFAPEIEELVNKQEKIGAGDVFSLGMIMKEMLKSQKDELEEFNKASNEIHSLAAHLKKLARACTSKSPDDRPTIDSIVSSLTSLFSTIPRLTNRKPLL